MDGTLACGLTTRMPESAKRCVAQLRENGHFTALATGRLQASAAEVAARYGFTDFVADGGYSLTLDGKLVEMRGLPVADCIAFIDRLETAASRGRCRSQMRGCCITSDARYLAVAPDDYFPTRVDPSFDYHQIRQIYKVNFALHARGGAHD